MSGEKQKLKFIVKGKKFSYEGYEANKEKDLLDLMVKVDLEQDLILSTFRENITGTAHSDGDIMRMYEESRVAREKKKAAKAAKAGGAAPPAETAPPVETAPAPAPAPPVQQETAPAPVAPQQPPAQQYDAGEAAQITQFIDQVLAEKPQNTEDRINNVPQEQQQPVASPVTGGAPAALGGKVQVYCQEEGTESSKIIMCDRSVLTYELFSEQVEKKFGQKMHLSFLETDGEKVIIDDDDVLEMFFSQAVKKLKLQCKPLTGDDAITGVEGGHNEGKQGADPESDKQGQLLHKEVRTYSGHSAAVYCCAFAPGKDRFVTASRDRSVRLWNVNDGENKVMKGGHNGLVLSCDFSPNGEFLVSSSDDASVKIWNASNQQKALSLKGHSDKVYCAEFNNTGAYVVTASCDRTVRVWNADSGAKQATLKGHNLAVFSCCFSNTDAGKNIASASDDRLIKLWDWRDNKCTRTLTGHTGTVWSCKYSPDDKYVVSASMDHELKLWDVGTGMPIKTLNGHLTPIHHAIFSPDGKYILSCARDWTVMVWETATGNHVDTIHGHRSTVYHMDLVGDQLLTCSLDETVKLWQFGGPN